MMGRRATVATLVFLLAACADFGPPADASRCFELAEIARFGDAEVVANGLDQRTIEAGAGVLGNIRGFTTDPPPIEEEVGPQQIRATPSQYRASAIAVLGDSLVLQAMLGFPDPVDWDNPPERGSETYSLVVLDRFGEHVDTVELPAGVDPSRLHMDHETGRIFMTASDPFPQVLAMELVACQRSG
jgi:hypothetical protein